DRRVLVFVFDLVAAEFHTARRRDVAHLLLRLLVAREPQRKIARRCGANVEMLVKGPVGRNDECAGLPVEALDWLVALPHQAVAIAVQDDDVCAWSVAVSL